MNWNGIWDEFVHHGDENVPVFPFGPKRRSSGAVSSDELFGPQKVRRDLKQAMQINQELAEYLGKA